MSPHPDDLLAALVDYATRGTPVALLLLLRASGSTPREAGARALVTADGALLGTVGGGPLEAEALRRAAHALESHQPEVFDLDLHGHDGQGSDPVCGGSVRLLIDPTPDQAASAYAQALAARQARQRGFLITRLDHGPELRTTVTHLHAERIPDNQAGVDPEVLSAALAREAPVHLAPAPSPGQATSEWLVEPLLPSPRLIIVGGGHVGQALAHQADWVGFDTVVIDDRSEFTASTRFPTRTATRCGDVAEHLQHLAFDDRTYLALVSRGHRHDTVALRACLRRPVAYLGMIGSRRKVALMRRTFLDSGWATPDEFDAVHAPIGLDIGSVTPREIAVSIVAQLIAVRRGHLPTGEHPA